MRYLWVWFCVFGSLVLGITVYAETYSSSNYTSADPVVTLEGNYASSSHFQLFGSSGPIVIGESTSTSFIYRTGFLYFPLVTAPSVVASAGNSSVQLTWNAADVALGYTVSGYSVGRSTVSGGPYSFTDVGAVLSSNQTGLNNGTTYYFVVRVKDFYTNSIATSTEVFATPVAGQQNNGGGGGGGGSAPQARINVSGNTFPNGLVHVVLNGAVVATGQSDGVGAFTITTVVPPGEGVYLLYAENKNGDRSGSVSYTTRTQLGTTTQLTNVIIPPILTTDKQVITTKETLTLFGDAIPNTTLVITIDEIPGLQIKVVANTVGAYSTPFSMETLGKGDYTAKARLQYGSAVSGQSLPVIFTVGDETKEREKNQCKIADFNCDGKVNLIDFSILIYWFDKPSTPTDIDLNNDARVDLIDFSILMYYWTGD